MGSGSQYYGSKKIKKLMKNPIFNSTINLRRTIFLSLVNWARKVRASIIRRLKPKPTNLFDRQPAHLLRPISNKYGFDRGKPIDRYYIEKFLFEHQIDIKGKCLEIHDNAYTVKFGGARVSQSDVLDINTKNKLANIHDDLKQLTTVPSNTYDCLIITQTLGLIDDYQSTLKECRRIIQPGGHLLFTGSSIGPIWDLKGSLWKFTPAGTNHIFSQFFTPKDLTVKTYGNLLTAQAYLVGLATEELTTPELDYHDPHFPVIITVRAVKSKS